MSRSKAAALFFFFHCFADERGVAGFGIDHGFRGHTTAGHRVGIFLLEYHTVFDEFGGGWRDLALYGRRGRSNRRLFRRTACQKQAKYQPSFPHALCFRSPAPACRWQSWLLAPADNSICGQAYCAIGRVVSRITSPVPTGLPLNVI
jgi:hypothetical protein